MCNECEGRHIPTPLEVTTYIHVLKTYMYMYIILSLLLKVIATFVVHETLMYKWKQLTFCANRGIYIGEEQHSISENENQLLQTILPATTILSE